MPIPNAIVSPPATVEEFRDRLEEMTDLLPRRLRQCADFIAANTDRIAISTVAELGAAADVPASALMRFCQVMGFSGFSEMQRMFRDAYRSGAPDYATRLSGLMEAGEGTPAAVLAEVIQAGRRSLEALAATVDEDALEMAVSRLASANVLHVIGLQRAFPVASYLAYAFEKTGVPAILHDGVGGLGRVAALQPEDALLAIDFAPSSDETLAFVEQARARGLVAVAIGDRMNGQLARNACCLLCVSEIDFGALRSLSATLALATGLAVAVGAARAARAGETSPPTPTPAASEGGPIRGGPDTGLSGKGAPTAAAAALCGPAIRPEPARPQHARADGTTPELRNTARGGRPHLGGLPA